MKAKALSLLKRARMYLAFPSHPFAYSQDTRDAIKIFEDLRVLVRRGKDDWRDDVKKHYKRGVEPQKKKRTYDTPLGNKPPTRKRVTPEVTPSVVSSGFESNKRRH